jgi:hypothetical protein
MLPATCCQLLRWRKAALTVVSKVASFQNIFKIDLVFKNVDYVISK